MANLMNRTVAIKTAEKLLDGISEVQDAYNKSGGHVAVSPLLNQLFWSGSVHECDEHVLAFCDIALEEARAEGHAFASAGLRLAEAVLKHRYFLFDSWISEVQAEYGEDEVKALKRERYTTVRVNLELSVHIVNKSGISVPYMPQAAYEYVKDLRRGRVDNEDKSYMVQLRRSVLNRTFSYGIGAYEAFESYEARMYDAREVYT